MPVRVLFVLLAVVGLAAAQARMSPRIARLLRTREQRIVLENGEGGYDTYYSSLTNPSGSFLPPAEWGENGFCPNYPPRAYGDQLTELLEDHRFTSAVAKLVDYYARIITTDSIPGLVVSVVYGDAVILEKGFGQLDPFNNTSEQINENSAVRIASISKTFCDLALFYLRDAGLVGLDDPLTKYFPDFSMKSPVETNRPLTLRMLASQSSGMPRDSPVFNVTYSDVTTEMVLSALKDQYLVWPYYQRPHYSNLGFNLLGHALGTVTSAHFNQSYEEFVEGLVWGAGMSRTSFNVSYYGNDNVATGVVYNASGYPFPAPTTSGFWSNPAGGLWSTATDMSKYMQMWLRRNATASDEQLLDAATFSEALKANIITHSAEYAWGTPFEFNYSQPLNVRVKNKDGFIDGYRSRLALVPDYDLGVYVTITNTIAPERTTYTWTALDTIIPVLDELLWELGTPALPKNVDEFTGLWELDGALVDLWVDDPYMHFALVIPGDPDYVPDVYNLTRVDDSTLRIFNALPLSCRSEDDSSLSGEYMYFSGRDSDNHFTDMVLDATPFTYTGYSIN